MPLFNNFFAAYPNSQPNHRVVRTLGGLYLHVRVADRMIASRGRYLYESLDDGHAWDKTELGLGVAASIRATSQLTSRLFRTSVSGLCRSPKNRAYYWVADRGLYKRIDGCSPKRIWDIKNGRRPLSQGICIDEDSVLLGDYWTNPERHEVQIHRINLHTDEHSVLHEFPRNTVRHVHTVQIDPYTSQLWVATGDDDHECKVGVFELGKMTPIGEGSQDWRVVGLAFTDDAVFWGTDDPYTDNVAYRWDRRTGIRTAIGRTIGPIYYATTNGRHVVFSTAVEMGKGYHDGFARIYAYDRDTAQFTEVFRAKKDIWSPKYFGYGTIDFAEQESTDGSFWAVLHGLVGGTRSIELQLPA